MRGVEKWGQRGWPRDHVCGFWGLEDQDCTFSTIYAQVLLHKASTEKVNRSSRPCAGLKSVEGQALEPVSPELGTSSPTTSVSSLAKWEWIFATTEGGRDDRTHVKCLVPSEHVSHLCTCAEFSLKSNIYSFSHKVMKLDSEQWCTFRNYLVWHDTLR